MRERSLFPGSTVQDLSDFLQQHVWDNGFGNEIQNFFLLLIEDVRGISAGKKTLTIRTQLKNLIASFFAVHLRHDHIENSQLDLVLMFDEFSYGIFTVNRLDYRIAECFKYLSGEVSGGDIVLGDEDSLRPSFCRYFPLYGFRRRRRLG